MRIAFFTDTYHPSVDGVVRSIDMFAQGLRARGHRVRVFAPDGGAAHARDGASYAPSLPFLPYPQYRMPIYTGEVIRRAVDWKPDVIHSHAMLSMGLAARQAAREAGVPLVGTFHTMVPQAMHYVSGQKGVQVWGEKLSWRYLRWFYQPFDLLMAPSAHLQNEISQHHLPSVVVPNPIDTARFKGGKIEARVAATVGAKRPALLYLGRLAQEKNLDYLLDLAAAPEFENWGARLLIAGGGPYKAALASRAREMGLHGRVRFLGRVAEKDLPSLYRAADFVLLPSQFETQGLVALESMACGTPVACVENTALAEVAIPGVSGVRWKEGSGSSEAVRVLQRGMASRRKLSNGAKKIARQYSIRDCTSRLLEAYGQAMASKKEN